VFVNEEGTDTVLVESRQLAYLMRECNGVVAPRGDVWLRHRGEALESQCGLDNHGQRRRSS
jgi:hypothetical protein